MEKEILVNRVQCLECGEILVSHHRNDYRTCLCKNETCVDGGEVYLRYGGKDLSKVKTLTIYSDDAFEKIREFLCRGGRGINGDEPLKYVPLKDMSDEWLTNVIDYEEQYRPNNKYLKYYNKELLWRNQKSQE